MYALYVIRTGAVFIILLSWVTAFDVATTDKTLNLKIGFDLSRGKNGAPSLRIRNFEEVPKFELGEKDKNKEDMKKSLRAESSSEESDEKLTDKVVPKVKVLSPESDGSDDADTSGSDDNRRLSTKGILPDEFEPEGTPSVHERIDKESDSE